MATHQTLSGTSDGASFLQRLVSNYHERFGADFWATFYRPDRTQAPATSDDHRPGLWPRPVLARSWGALSGRHALRLRCDPSHDHPRPAIADDRCSPDAGDSRCRHTAPATCRWRRPHLVTMTSVLHVLDEPLPVLGEIRRVLAPNGLFLLHDWSFACRYRPISPRARNVRKNRRRIAVSGVSVSSQRTASTPPRIGSGCWVKPALRSAIRRNRAHASVFVTTPVSKASVR